MNGERLPKLCKELRKEAHLVSLRKLMALDRGDRALLEGMLERVINDLIRIQAIGDAKCSCVLELFEHMGGQIRSCKS